MIIPAKEEYCRKRAAEETYDDISYDRWGNKEIEHFKAEPKEFETEYDNNFNIQYIGDRIKENIDKINDLNKKIIPLVDHWEEKTTPIIPLMADENLDEYKKLRIITLQEIERLERILNLAQ